MSIPSTSLQNARISQISRFASFLSEQSLVFLNGKIKSGQKFRAFLPYHRKEPELGSFVLKSLSPGPATLDASDISEILRDFRELQEWVIFCRSHSGQESHLGKGMDDVIGNNVSKKLATSIAGSLKFSNKTPKEFRGQERNLFIKKFFDFSSLSKYEEDEDKLLRDCFLSNNSLSSFSELEQAYVNNSSSPSLCLAPAPVKDIQDLLEKMQILSACKTKEVLKESKNDFSIVLNHSNGEEVVIGSAKVDEIILSSFHASKLDQSILDSIFEHCATDSFFIEKSGEVSISFDVGDAASNFIEKEYKNLVSSRVSCHVVFNEKAPGSLSGKKSKIIFLIYKDDLKNVSLDIPRYIKTSQPGSIEDLFTSYPFSSLSIRLNSSSKSSGIEA